MVHIRQCQQHLLETIGDILTGKEVYVQYLIDCGILRVFRGLLVDLDHNKKAKTVKEICWAISNITASNQEHAESVMDAEIFPILTKLLSSASSTVSKEALWAITNATEKNNVSPKIAACLVESGVFEVMLSKQIQLTD